MRPSKKNRGLRGAVSGRLDQIINMQHELVRLANELDWEWIDVELAGCFADQGRPGVPTRFMIGLLLLKHIYGLSHERVCERWEHDPYFEYFTDETFFQHALSQRALRAEPLAQAHRRQAGGADGRTCPRSKQLKRAGHALRFLHTHLGRLIRNIRRKTEGDDALREAFALPLSKATQIHRQRQSQWGRKLYSWHAPEAECIGNSKAGRTRHVIYHKRDRFEAVVSGLSLEPRIIFLTRHPRNIIGSTIKRTGVSAEEAVVEFRASVAEAGEVDRYLSDRYNVFHLAYEDFVSDPRDMLAKILDFVGLPDNPALADAAAAASFKTPKQSGNRYPELAAYDSKISRLIESTACLRRYAV